MDYNKVMSEFNEWATGYLGRTVKCELIKDTTPEYLVPNIHLLTNDQQEGGDLLKKYHEIYKKHLAD